MPADAYDVQSDFPLAVARDAARMMQG